MIGNEYPEATCPRCGGKDLEELANGFWICTHCGYDGDARNFDPLFWEAEKVMRCKFCGTTWSESEMLRHPFVDEDEDEDAIVVLFATRLCPECYPEQLH